MFWLFLESGRPVLEQLELCVNSHVCSVEAELHLKMIKNNLRVYIHFMLAQVLRVLQIESVNGVWLAQRLIVHINFTITDLPRCSLEAC